jgi:hypothetical protein
MISLLVKCARGNGEGGSPAALMLMMQCNKSDENRPDQWNRSDLLSRSTR